jgi:DNA-binding transcriptional LysR family regulator
MIDRPDFSLTQLLYFVAIAETGNISEAAVRLHASQSAVSSAIQRLERQLGSQLLVRQHAKGVTLTPCGRLLVQDARKILRQAHDLKDRSTRLQGQAEGRLEAGCCSTITPFLMPRTLARLTVSRPKLKVNVHDTQAPIEMLRNGVCELAVTYNFASSEETNFTELAAPPMYAVISHRHALADAERASLAELAEEPLLMLELPPASAHHGYMQSVFAQAGVPMPRVIRATGLEAMRGLVGAGMGFMLTHHRPRSTETLDGGKVALVEISDRRPHLSIGVQILAGVEPSQRARDFVSALRVAAQQVYAPMSGAAA